MHPDIVETKMCAISKQNSHTRQTLFRAMLSMDSLLFYIVYLFGGTEGLSLSLCIALGTAATHRRAGS